ncbi:MAG: DUF4199 domain-containing protein [Bacteroidales bacterium]|jgi:hypothetical protein|nr:DUF4199 domain-containing protein [Bacteroidales bacterium]
MQEKISGKEIWNNSAKSGLILGLASSVFIFIGLLTQKMSPGFLSSAVGFILWLVKFILCIYIMMYFQKKLVSDYTGVTNTDTFRYGMGMAFFSAVIYSAAVIAEIFIVGTDAITGEINTVMQSYSGMMDSNSINAMDKVKDNISQLMLIFTFIYCFLYGTILSFITSRSIPSDNPFAENGQDIKTDGTDNV